MTPVMQLETLNKSAKASQAEPNGNVLGRWLVVFSQAFRFDVSRELAAIYRQGLCDLSAEVLEEACNEALKTCKFFPTIAEIREPVSKTKARSREVSAEIEWTHLVREWIPENFHPDLGFREARKPLQPCTSHAARAAGGIRYLASCSEDQLTWARKIFVQAFLTAERTGQDAHLLGAGEAKKILANISQHSETSAIKALSPVLVVKDEKPKLADVRSVLNSVIAEKPLPSLTEDELSRRRDEMKRKAAEWQSRQAV